MGHLSLCFSLRKNKPNKVAVYLYVSQTWFISPLFIACIGGVLQNKVSSTLLLKEKHKQAEFQNVLPSSHQRPEVIPEAMEQMQSVGVCGCVCARVRARVCLCVQVHVFLHVHVCGSQKKICNLGISFFRSCLPWFSVWCETDDMRVFCM